MARVEGGGHGDHVGEIARRQNLQPPEEREEPEISPVAVAQGAVEEDQGERGPEEPEELQVPDLPEAPRREAVQGTRHQRRPERSRPVPGEAERREARERERQDEERVVGGQWITGEPQHRTGDGKDAEQVVREGERQLDGKSDVGVEELARIAAQRVNVPGQNPGIEERIQEIGRDMGAEVPYQRERLDHGQGQKQAGGPERARHRHPNLSRMAVRSSIGAKAWGP